MHTIKIVNIMLDALLMDSKILKIFYIFIFFFSLILLPIIGTFMTKKYIVDGFYIPVDAEMIKHLQNNIYWIAGMNNNRPHHISNESSNSNYLRMGHNNKYWVSGENNNLYWVDEFSDHLKNKFYCGKNSLDNLCINDVKKFVKKKCTTLPSESLFWTEPDGIFINWNGSRKDLLVNLKNCNIEYIGKIREYSSYKENFNLLLVTFFFSVVLIIPFALDRKKI